jgi:hypothetical protein
MKSGSWKVQHSRNSLVIISVWGINAILTVDFTDPEPYVFTDSSLEQHYNFSFKDLLKKPNRSELFKVRN